MRCYFVDEAGDGILFDRKGNSIIGTEGCSRFFILGAVDVPQPEIIAGELGILRERLLQDPLLSNIPSMQLSQRKTALAFHAKDDIPEVRYEMYHLLRKFTDIRFFAIVRDKTSVLEYVRQRNKSDLTYRYHPNELYDYMVRRLFKEKLHKEKEYQICFAKRGNSNRTKALREALDSARHRFAQQWGIISDATIHVTASYPANTVCLQVADYFIWALQRLFERSEDRYLRGIWSSCSLICDADDPRGIGKGVFYNKKKPLTLAALQGRWQI